MDEKQWKDIVTKERNVSRSVILLRTDYALIACCSGCMACVYDCVLKGWVEYKGTLNENIKAVGKAVFSWYKKWCDDCKVAAMADVMWFTNAGEFNEKIFKTSYINFSYDVGMLFDTIVYEKEGVESLVWNVVCDYIDIVSMFMSQEEFYNLMMGNKKEDKEDEV